MIESIDTFYNGNYFRSRLEARWAVYFDLVGIEYQYEPAGFEFRGKYDYLPDFYLPKFEIYCEIKNRNAFSVDRNSQKLESGTENAFRYQKIAEEMHKEGILWAMFIGSPYEIFHESPWWCFQEDWSFYGAEIDSILEEHMLPDSYKWAGESSAKCRFEHGCDPDEYVRHEKRRRELLSAVRITRADPAKRRQQYEKEVIGILVLHPEYTRIQSNNKYIKNYDFTNDHFNVLIHYLEGIALYNKAHPDQIINVDSVIRDCNGDLTEEDIEEINKCKQNREECSINNEVTYRQYLEALFEAKFKEEKEQERQDLWLTLQQKKLDKLAEEFREAKS